MEHDPESAVEDANVRDDLVFQKQQIERILRTTTKDDEGTVEHTLLLSAWTLATGMLYLSNMAYDLREILNESRSNTRAPDNVRPLGTARKHEADAHGDDDAG